MLIQINSHTFERAEERGATKNEIEDVIRIGIPVPAKRNRQAKEKVFDFHRHWRKTYYEQKKVQVIYVLREGVAITVTVYVFYGNWEV